MFSKTKEILGHTGTALLGKLPFSLHFATPSHYDEQSNIVQNQLVASSYNAGLQVNNISLNASMSGSQCWKDSSSTFMDIRSDSDSDMQQDD